MSAETGASLHGVAVKPDHPRSNGVSPDNQQLRPETVLGCVDPKAGCGQPEAGTQDPSQIARHPCILLIKGTGIGHWRRRPISDVILGACDGDSGVDNVSRLGFLRPKAALAEVFFRSATKSTPAIPTDGGGKDKPIYFDPPAR
jgi:hypothetical protein